MLLNTRDMMCWWHVTPTESQDSLRRNTEYFRQQLETLGFELTGAGHPIIPVMIGEAPLAQRFAERMLEEGIYVVGFFFPVVPKGKARIRTQMSAAHTQEHLDQCIDAFARIGRELGVIGK